MYYAFIFPLNSSFEKIHKSNDKFKKTIVWQDLILS